MRRCSLLLTLLAGCTSRPEDYRLGPWRQIQLPVRAIAMDVVGKHLMFVDQLGGLWAAEIIRE